MARPSRPARSCSSGTRTGRPILAEVGGIIRFVDIIEGETVQTEELRTKTAKKGKDADAKIVERPVVIEHKGDKHPQIMIEDAKGKILDVHYLPAGARIEVKEGQEVQAGQLLAPPAARRRAVRRTSPAVCRA